MTFASVHDMLTPPSVVMKTHRWDWFSGSQLKSAWDVHQENGTNTVAMSDTVNGGVELTTGTTSGNRLNINFNSLRHYSETGSVFICTMQRPNDLSQQWCGLTNTRAYGSNYFYHLNNSLLSTYRFATRDGSTTNTINYGTNDTSFHVYTGAVDSNSAKGWLDGALVALSTANLPAAVLHPSLRVRTETGAARTGLFRYFEAYNT